MQLLFCLMILKFLMGMIVTMTVLTRTTMRILGLVVVTVYLGSVGCKAFGFVGALNLGTIKYFPKVTCTLLEPFSGSVSSLLDAQRLVAIPSTCQSTDFEGEIPRYIYLKYVVFQR